MTNKYNYRNSGLHVYPFYTKQRIALSYIINGKNTNLYKSEGKEIHERQKYLFHYDPLYENINNVNVGNTLYYHEHIVGLIERNACYIAEQYCPKTLIKCDLIPVIYSIDEPSNKDVEPVTFNFKPNEDDTNFITSEGGAFMTTFKLEYYQALMTGTIDEFSFFNRYKSQFTESMGKEIVEEMEEVLTK